MLLLAGVFSVSPGSNDHLDLLLSRTITLPAGEEAQALESNVMDNWRLVLSIGNTSDVNVRITVRNMASSYQVVSTVNRGGAIDYTGYGSCTIEVLNLTAAAVEVKASLVRQTSETPKYQFNATAQVVTNAGFSLVNSDTVDGFSPPFCRYVRLFCDAQIDLQFVDSAGTVVGAYNGMNPEDVLLNELHVPPLASLQARATGAGNVNLMALWF